MVSRGRARKKQKTGSRLDAALEAMAKYGFGPDLVSQAVMELLDVYGDDGWSFFEDNSYLVLLDTLLAKSEEPKQEDHSPQGLAGSSNQHLTSSGPSKEELHNRAKEVAETAMLMNDPVDSITDSLGTPLQKNESDSPFCNVFTRPAQQFPVRTRKPCYGWISSDDEDPINIAPATLPDTLARFLLGTGVQRKRPTRWDVRPEGL